MRITAVRPSVSYSLPFEDGVPYFPLFTGGHQTSHFENEADSCRHVTDSMIQLFSWKSVVSLFRVVYTTRDDSRNESSTEIVTLAHPCFCKHLMMNHDSVKSL